LDISSGLARGANFLSKKVKYTYNILSNICNFLNISNLIWTMWRC